MMPPPEKEGDNTMIKKQTIVKFGKGEIATVRVSAGVSSQSKRKIAWIGFSDATGDNLPYGHTEVGSTQRDETDVCLVFEDLKTLNAVIEKLQDLGALFEGEAEAAVHQEEQHTLITTKGMESTNEE